MVEGDRLTFWLNLFVEASKRVREAVLPLFGTSEGGKKVGVGASGDVTKYIDKVAEDTLVNFLMDKDVSFVLVSEELGVKSFGSNPEGYVVADPIDGSENAARGVPVFSISLAFASENSLRNILVGVVQEVIIGNIFTAVKGRGAYFNGEKISSSTRTSLDDSLVGFDLSGVDSSYIQKIGNAIVGVRRVRHLGSNAYEMCLVAKGVYDAFVDMRGKLRVTDVAAATLIVEEAGGTVIDENGKPLDSKLDPNSRVSFIAAGNTIIAKKLLNLTV